MDFESPSNTFYYNTKMLRKNEQRLKFENRPIFNTDTSLSEAASGRKAVAHSQRFRKLPSRPIRKILHPRYNILTKTSTFQASIF
jgi:hypothetical protein